MHAKTQSNRCISVVCAIMADEDKILTRQPELFGNVIITLDNVLIPDAKLSQTPSVNDGLDIDTEIDLRILGCEFIQSAGILLRLPQVDHRRGILRVKSMGRRSSLAVRA